MGSRPLVASMAEAQRLVDGRAAHVMRPMRPQPVRDIDNRGGKCWVYASGLGGVPFWPEEKDKDSVLDMSPFGEPGGKLWVREPWAAVHADVLDVDAAPHPYLYQASDTIREDSLGNWYAARDVGSSYGLGIPCTDFVPPARHPRPVWKRAIFMPRKACRLVLVVESVDVVREDQLDDIDARLAGYDSKGAMGRELAARWGAPSEPGWFWFASVFPEERTPQP